MYKIEYYKKALKDIPKLKASGLDKKAKLLIDLIKEDPFQNPPPYEKLLGDLMGYYSRRINIQHKLVYEVLEDEKVIRIILVCGRIMNKTVGILTNGFVVL